MSRIDQALRNWESATGAIPAAASVSEPAAAATLADYPAEGGRRVILEEAPVQPVQPLQPLVGRRPTGRTSMRVRDNAYLAARLITGSSSSVSLEQYRRVAAVLHEAQVHGNLKTVMVTSALPGEGKSLTVANLAHTLSGSYGRRVLVIDADLRAPNLHRIFALRNSAGLSEALRNGRHELPFVEVSEGLSVLTAGRPGSAPLAGLISDRMGEIVLECASSFDWVLIDTPPVGLLPDAQVLARFAGAVLFVIAAGATPKRAIERAVADLGQDSIIGTVLNRVDERRIPQADYYDYYGADESSVD